MRSTRRVAVGLLVLWAGCIPALGADGTAAAKKITPPPPTWDRLSKAIKAVDSAKTADEAVAAYARGCSINRGSVRLQRAYLRRMLQFGRPDIAMFPAETLSKTDPTNGLAWGVIAYVWATRSQYHRALPVALKAAELEPENPSICQNAAQLLVWYEQATPTPSVPASVRGTIKKFQSASRSSKTFGAAYKQAKAAFGDIANDKKDVQQKIDDVKKEADKIKKELDNVAGTIRSRGKSYDAERRRLDSLRRNLQRIEYDMTRRSYSRGHDDIRRRRDRALRDVRERERRMRLLVDEAKKLQTRKNALIGKHRAKLAEIKQLEGRKGALAAGVPRSFHWRPPAVDGVVTPVAKAAGKTPGKATPGKATPPKVSRKALDVRVAEAEAADKLDLAKLYMGSKLNSSAKKLLREIIDTYPDTAAGKEAVELVKKLP
jgi:tetratricopeptide (TPR) repeat protein